jgi:hypothetical protein
VSITLESDHFWDSKDPKGAVNATALEYELALSEKGSRRPLLPKTEEGHQ